MIVYENILKKKKIEKENKQKNCLFQLKCATDSNCRFLFFLTLNWQRNSSNGNGNKNIAISFQQNLRI